MVFSARWSENPYPVWVLKFAHQTQKSLHLQRKIKPFQIILQLFTNISAQCPIESTKKRKEDTRKKILLGALVVHLIETGYFQKEEIYKQLDKFLDKEIDRKLFGLDISEK